MINELDAGKDLKSGERAGQKQVIRTKQSLHWNFIFLLLQNLDLSKEIMADDGFRNLYDDLLSYVANKIPLPSGGEILDWYVVVEQEATE